jgi:iron complex transport system substrate-binding protein
MTRRLSLLAMLVLVVTGLAVAPASAAVPADSGGAEASLGSADAASNASTAGCAFPFSSTDATGTEVTVEERPDTITVLAPSAAQTVWDLGRADSVVGMPVNQYTEYLGGTEGKVNVVNDQGQPITESVVGTDPDVVLAPNIVGNDAIESLREAGLTVYKFEPADSIGDVLSKTTLTGQLIGACDEAETVTGDMESTIADISAQVDDDERPTVYYPLGGGFTAGNQTFIGDLIQSAGGDNVATEADITGYAVISQEVLANATIDYLLLTGDSPRPMNPAINNSRAVAEDNIVRVDANLLNQPGPRVVVPLSQMANAFFEYDPAGGTDEGETDDGTETGDETETDDGTEMDNGTEPTMDEETTQAPPTTIPAPSPATDVDPVTTADGDGPGFGIGAAVLAVVATALVAVRRR